MSKYSIAIFALLLILTNSCKDTFEGSGPMVTLSRPISNFTRVSLYNNVNLVIAYDTTCSLLVEAPENWMDKISTEVINGALIIKNKQKALWLKDPDKKITVTIHVPFLDGIDYEATGTITTIEKRIIAGDFTLNVIDGAGSIHLMLAATNVYLNTRNGVSDVNVKGHTQNLYIYSDAVSPIDCVQFYSENTKVVSKGTNNCSVVAMKKLDVNISSKGNVYYYGDPDTILSTITGEGKLIKL
ncbi:MAG: DUF2807 domain-containing protein [Bacteroidota bacterium]